MADVDVTELLSDPDFTDDLVLINRSAQVNSRGENVLGEVQIPTFGSVQPATGRVINRLPEAMRVANISSFWLKGTIVSSAPGKYSSVIVFKGLRYQVQTVQNWSNWGEGYTEGTCVAEVLTS